MGVEAYKIGSGECNNLPLIRHIAGFGRPMVVSTGMNDIASVTQCVEILRAARVPFALLHTTNLYPTPLHLVRLGAMQELQAAFPDVEVGLSDHTISNHACFAAVALGANIVERHFTDRKDRIGPDIINSMDQLDLKELILGIEAIAQMRGGEKKTIPEEQVTMDFAFATVVAIRNIRKGEVLTTDNIWVKRPGVGEIKAVHFDQLPGRVCRRNIAADEHLCWEDLADE
ncbi:polyhydroxyalkanoate biosynthesis repressor PhaR [candidate division KSB3 bacterium]|nr:MAG: polyhydroxyalkanoate biosynthesis repressor PhaR [candidate division KSB3 bacterium]